MHHCWEIINGEQVIVSKTVMFIGIKSYYNHHHSRYMRKPALVKAM